MGWWIKGEHGEGERDLGLGLEWNREETGKAMGTARVREMTKVRAKEAEIAMAEKGVERGFWEW
jgi:hypothetical protein